MITRDTYAVIYWLGDCTEVSDPARAAIADALDGGEVLISSISVLEVAQFVEIGRLVLSIDTRRWLATLTSIEGGRIVPVDTAIAMRAASVSSDLPVVQRIIAATARTPGIPLVTPDWRVRELRHVETVW